MRPTDSGQTYADLAVAACSRIALRRSALAGSRARACAMKDADTLTYTARNARRPPAPAAISGAWPTPR